MWKILVCLMVLVTVWQGVAGTAGDGVLSGYLVLNDDKTCLGTNGISVATPDSTSQAHLASACIKLYLVEGSAPQKYKILTLLDQTKKLKLAVDMPPAFVDDGSDTEVQFSDTSAQVAAATAGSVTSITTKTGAFLIQLSDAMVSEAACLTATPEYKGATCGSIKWYFIAVDCTLSECVTCVDALKCDSCTDGTHVVKDDNSACEDCDTAITGCTTCSDTTGTAKCSACGATKTLHSDGTSCVADCTVDNCKYCDTAPATCDTCDDGYNIDENTCEGKATTTGSSGSALTTTIELLMAVVALKSLIVI